MAGDRVQVFLSSTWEDLRAERAAVERALHRMADTGFVGMEYFGSRPDTPREASLTEVDRSDCYVGIFGFRYGSGITEAEYVRARERGLPCLIYFASDRSLAAERGEAGAETAAALDALKRRLGHDHIVTYFDSPDDLAAKVATDLHNLLSQSRRETQKPADAAESRPKTNLPAQVDSFVGRAAELAKVKALSRQARLVTLTGTGGIGKTRLALQAASELLAEGDPALADGVWFVDLSVITEPGLMPRAIASAFGLRDQPGRALIDVIVDHLAPARLLLVLDNCEHLLLDCAAVVDRLLRACPGLRVLATSRTVLGIPGETAWAVPPLSLPPPSPLGCAELTQFESTRLFLERARARDARLVVAERDASAIAAACRRVEGIPLAIELAAARVRSLSVEQIADRLADRFALLTGGNPLVPRHRALRAAVDWSHDLLSEAEQVMFRRLAIFVGGCTLEDAEAVCGDDRIALEDVPDLLARLVDASLVQVDARGDVRYGLLDTLHQYALERLVASADHDPVARRHVARYLALAERAQAEMRGAQQGEWFDRLDQDNENLRAALRRAVAQQDAETGLRLVVALARYWELRGQFAEGRAWIESFLQLVDRGAHTSLHAQALSGLGLLAWQQGDYAAARSAHEESLAIRRGLGDRRGTAASLGNLGLLAHQEGDYATAQARYEESLATWRVLGDDWATAIALNNLGGVADEQGDEATAQALHEESLALRRKLGDTWGIAASLANLGNVAYRRRDFGAAHSLHSECLALKRDLDDKWGIALSLSNLGQIAHAQGDDAAALASWHESLTISKEAGHRLGIAQCLEGFAAVAAARDQPEHATRLLGAADALREAIGAPLAPVDRADHDRKLAQLRARLDEREFSTAWADGRAMTVEQAVTLALEELPA